MTELDWMQTFTGRHIYPLSTKPQDFVIEDIAHALSMICRFNGQSRVFYSVGEHSVLLAEFCEQKNYEPELSLWALMHDAAEAYLGDVIRPIKQNAMFTGESDTGSWSMSFHGVESLLITRIFEALGLTEHLQNMGHIQSVKMLDSRILVDESMELMGEVKDWGELQDYQPLGVSISGLPPFMVEQRFLSAYNRLLAILKK